MSITLTATEAKAKILSLLDQVSEGEEIEITKRGRPVARLVPARGAHSLRGKHSGQVASSAEDEELFSTGVDWDLP
jgi:prevent-host-death family protein